MWERERYLWSLGLAVSFVWKALHAHTPGAHFFTSSFSSKITFSMRPRLNGVRKPCMCLELQVTLYSSLQITWLFNLQLIYLFSTWRVFANKVPRGICWWGNSVSSIHLFHHNSRGISLDNHVIAMHSAGSCLGHYNSHLFLRFPPQ